MPSSLILQGGAAQTRTLVDDIVQDDHGLVQGDVVRWDTIGTRYVRALADTPSNAEVVGIVSEVANSSNFKITYSGYVSIPALSSLSDPVLFLSSTVPGGLVGSPPSAVGSVVKPVLTRNTTTGGYIFTNYLGTQIGGSSTISVDEIQPVGTIMPFAGGTIPDTWLPCEGTAYSIADYPELYAKVLRTDGDRAPSYGHVANISVPAALYGAAGVGQIAILRNAGAVDAANYDLIGRITAKTAANNTLTVQILPKYDATTRTFAFPNSVAVVGANIRVYTNLNLSAQVGSGGAVSAVVLTHFNVPDLRGRFALGSNGTAIAENTQEGDSAYNSALSVYNLGSLGGEERHTLTSGEMPSHTHSGSATDSITIPEHDHFLFGVGGGNQRTFFGPGNYGGSTPQNQNDVPRPIGNGQGDNVNFEYSITSGGSQSQATKSGKTFKSDSVTIDISPDLQIQNTGSNIPHNNMPPYVAVRYIIKAKPYTRAAIIGGIDLPYNDLLVRNLRTRNVGGTNEDLLFHVNVSGDSGSGTERMRLGNMLTLKPTQSGTVLTGTGRYGGIHLEQSGGNDNFVGMTTTATSSGTQGGILIQGSGNYGTKIHFLTTDSYSQGMKQRMVLDNTGRLGIGKTDPQVTLDVSGNAAVSGTLSAGGAATLNSLSVTNFGTSNVLVKPNNTIGQVGMVVPIISSYGSNAIGSFTQSSIPIPSGTWFVFLTAHDNSVGYVDEDVHFVMAKIWTVPTGNYLRFGNIAKTPSQTDTTLGYWLDNSSLRKTSLTGFTEFKTTGSGDAKVYPVSPGASNYLLNSPPNYSVESGTDYPSILYQSAFADGLNGLANWVGYAMRIG
jgi:microcystin-dependent protein